MSDYKVILKDDDGNDCLVENILDFQKAYNYTSLIRGLNS